jgi:hypothetical protein
VGHARAAPEITFAEMRSADVRALLVYCTDYCCGSISGVSSARLAASEVLMRGLTWIAEQSGSYSGILRVLIFEQTARTQRAFVVASQATNELARRSTAGLFV